MLSLLKSDLTYSLLGGFMAGAIMLYFVAGSEADDAAAKVGGAEASMSVEVERS